MPEPPTQDAPTTEPAAPAPPPRHRPRRWVVAGIVTAVVLALGGALVLWWFEARGPSEPSIGDALGRFRSSSAEGGAVAGRPEPGVYLYAGIGEERLSFLATHQSQDGDLPGTVTLRPNGCWTFAIQLNSFHRETWNRCLVDGRLVEHGNSTEQKFDFGPLSQREQTDVVCDPPTTFVDPAFTPGHRERVRCRGHSQTTKSDMTQRGRLTFVGPTTVLVGATRVAALHFSQELTTTGDQTGTQHEEVWIARRDGLPLREERTIRIESPAPAPLGHVTYTEDGSWRLTSMTPRT